jgi:hypothetical protein
VTLHVHIQRLVLDDLALERPDRTIVEAALSGELSRLLGSRGLGPDLAAGAARDRIDAGSISVTPGDPALLGQAIASAVHRGMSR